MAVKMRCPCGKVLKTTSTGAGRRVKCPACGTISRMPGTRVMPTIQSPKRAPAATPNKCPVPPIPNDDSDVFQIDDDTSDEDLPRLV